MYIDLINKIKNAEAAQKKTLKVRFTTMDAAVVKLLEEKGFVKKAETKGRIPKRIIEIELDPTRTIRGVKILSKPSRRLYAGYKDLKLVKGGFGFLFLSTPSGIITDKEARKKKIGGELLFEIW